MTQLEVVLGLLVAVSILAVAAQRLQTPYPITLVLGGLVLGFVPGLPHVTLAPDVVFVVFLPPLVYATAQATSLRDVRANLRPIISLALGLALATVAVVAVVAHAAVAGLSWPAAFVLGAIVAPTDPIAVSAIAGHLRAPRHIITVVETESLVNDGVGLVAYRIAVAAVMTGAFSVWRAGLQFVLISAGGVAVGLLVGWCVVWLHRHLDHTSVEITLTLLTPFMAYLPASALGLSGVLAVMTAGVYLARQSSTLFTSDMRLEGAAVWDIFVFLLNGILFILLGLQLREILANLPAFPVRTLALDAVIVCLVVIIVRPLWVFPATYVPRLLRRRSGTKAASWRETAVISWSGMRGSASIAAALSLPLTTDRGMPFPERTLVTFLVFTVILSTLLLQGLSLPGLIRLLGVSGDGAVDREEHRARIAAAFAGVSRIEQLAGEEWLSDETFTRTQALYRNRLEQLTHSDGHALAASAASFMHGRQQLRREAIAAERETLIHLRDRGLIGDAILRRLERELDLEELSLHRPV